MAATDFMLPRSVEAPMESTYPTLQKALDHAVTLRSKRKQYGMD